MPYTKDDLPDAVKSMPNDAMMTWMKTYNAASASGQDEASCAKIAWAAVKKMGYAKGSDGKWQKTAMMGFSETVERDAELFEAGEYPDKGVTVTEADLDNIVSGFTEADIAIEHGSPFDGFLGKLTRVWRDGAKLLGKLAFDPAAWALAEKAGAKKLSIGLRPDKSGISEVSLVRYPRVSTAQVFAFDAGDMDKLLSREDVIDRFAALIGVSGKNAQSDGGDTTMGDTKTGTEQTVDFAAENEKLKAQIATLAAENATRDAALQALQFSSRVRDVDAKLDAAKREGKLTPACEPFAKIVMLQAGTEPVEFSYGENQTFKGTVSEAFEQFLAAMPKVIDFGETGGRGKNDGAISFSEEEIAVYMRMNPGQSREKAVELMNKYAK